MFEGFSQQSFDFLWELAMHNERPWFQAHREEFETVLNRPFRALATDTLALMGQRFPGEALQLHVSRIYRDARRLFGRGPYKDNLWFSLQPDPRARGPMLWFEIGLEGCSHGMGSWDRTPEQAQLFRKKIDAHPDRFAQLVLSLPNREQCRLWGEEYKKPKGSRGELIDPWYNRKTVSVGYENAFGDRIFGKELPGLLADSFAGLMPMYRFFREVYLASQKPEDL